jgi:site-specific DNA-methyltransferase (adenine-specific)
MSGSLILGNHKLINDDCMNVMTQMPSNSVHLIVTDPPYGIDYCSHRVEDRRVRIIGDTYFQWDWLTQAFRVLMEGGAAYIFCHWKTYHLLYEAVGKTGFKIKNLIVLIKNRHGMGDLEGSYAPTYELLLFVSKGKHRIHWNHRMKDVWRDMPIVPSALRTHPCEKTEEWVLPAIRNSSWDQRMGPGGIVLDPFMGTGIVPLTALKEGRQVIGIEIDPNYYKIAVNRFCTEFQRQETLPPCTTEVLPPVKPGV